jgi:hypothetical protein
MIAVRDALTVATTHGAIADARTIGGDRSAGEIDPDAVDAALEAIHERRAPLDVLLSPPANAVKFLKRTEAGAIAPIVGAGEAAFALPLSILRLQLFGAVQTRISQALRRGDRAMVARLIDGGDSPGYARRAHGLGRLHDHLEHVLLASFHCLLRARHEEAITVMLYLRPAADLTPLAALFAAYDGCGDTVVRLAPPAAGERFVNAIAADPTLCPEIAGLLRDAAAASRGMTRKGFQGAGSNCGAAPFAAAVEALIALRRTAGRFLARLSRDEAEWDALYRTDREIFQARFRALYGEIR